MSCSTSARVTGQVGAAVKANYLMEVCKEVLNDPRFSIELESSCFFHTAASLLEHEASKRFSDKLESHLNGLFKSMHFKPFKIMA